MHWSGSDTNTSRRCQRRPCGIQWSPRPCSDTASGDTRRCDPARSKSSSRSANAVVRHLLAVPRTAAWRRPVLRPRHSGPAKITRAHLRQRRERVRTGGVIRPRHKAWSSLRPIVHAQPRPRPCAQPAVAGRQGLHPFGGGAAVTELQGVPRRRSRVAPPAAVAPHRPGTNSRWGQGQPGPRALNSPRRLSSNAFLRLLACLCCLLPLTRPPRRNVHR